MLRLTRFAVAGLIFSALLFSPPASRAQSQPTEKPAEQAAVPTYDGDWWLSLGGWEQYGAISGYEDCYAFEYRGSVAFTKEIQAYIDDLNKYFLSDVTLRKQTVSEALDAMRKAGGDQSSPAPSDSPTSPHGDFDGKFWFDADPAAELGFVEGYLACHSAKLKDADAKFSKLPSEYVDLINKAYNITDDTDDVDADKAPMKIADVLHRLKDEEAPPPKPAR
jgi:hypothetical protein